MTKLTVKHENPTYELHEIPCKCTCSWKGHLGQCIRTQDKDGGYIFSCPSCNKDFIKTTPTPLVQDEHTLDQTNATNVWATDSEDQ